MLFQSYVIQSYVYTVPDEFFTGCLACSPGFFLLFAQNEGASISSLVGADVTREIKHRVFFCRERQRGSRDLTFPAFAVCRSPFLLEEDIFPVWRERENVSICSPFLLSISPF